MKEVVIIGGGAAGLAAAIACYDAGITMVHILCLNAEMLLLCGRIRAIAAGIAIAIHFDHTCFGGNGC